MPTFGPISRRDLVGYLTKFYSNIFQLGRSPQYHLQGAAESAFPGESSEQVPSQGTFASNESWLPSCCTSRQSEQFL